MRRYLLFFLAGHTAAVLLCLGMMGLAFANWFMSPEPLWFTVLALLVSLLPYPAAGGLAGRRGRDMARPHRGLPVLLGAMALIWLVSMLAEEHYFQLFFTARIWGLPSFLTAGIAAELLNLKYRWGYQVYLQVVEPALGLAGFLLPALLYHLAWTIRRRANHGAPSV